MSTENEIRDALTNVMDPEIHMNIIELNMVKKIQIKNDVVDVLIALTVAGCPLADTIKRDVKNELIKLQGINKVNADTTVMSKEELSILKTKVQKKSGKSEKDLIGRLEKKNNENIIAVVSGKGGVGKSLITALFASELKAFMALPKELKPEFDYGMVARVKNEERNDKKFNLLVFSGVTSVVLVFFLLLNL